VNKLVMVLVGVATLYGHPARASMEETARIHVWNDRREKPEGMRSVEIRLVGGSSTQGDSGFPITEQAEDFISALPFGTHSCKVKIGSSRYQLLGQVAAIAPIYRVSDCTKTR